MITSAQLSKASGLSKQAINLRARRGRIKGGIKVGQQWEFPDDTVLERELPGAPIGNKNNKSGRNGG